MSVPALHHPLYQPGLAYRHAFDWLAVNLRRAEGAAAALVPGLFQGVELLRRLPELSFFEPLPPGLIPAGLRLGLQRVNGLPPRRRLAAAAWVEPRVVEQPRLYDIARRLAPGGRLYIVVGGPLAGYLAERRRQQESYMDRSMVTALLALQGLRVVDSFGLHGPRAIAWHYLGAAAARLGLAARADRCHYAMRRSFAVRGAAQRLCALHCLVGEVVE